MKKTIVILGALFLLTACSTVQGLGEDLSNTGDDISDLAKKIESGMSTNNNSNR